MAGWRTHEGRAVHLALENVDTDQLIPARFMSTPRSEGYGAFLLHDLRLQADGTRDPLFPLNRDDDLTVIVAGRSFGTGSSREAAVYALVDAGMRAVVAPSFGDIFAANAVNNGLLPAQVTEDAHAELAAALKRGPTGVKIDLEAQTLDIGDLRVTFKLDASWRAKLINGWDDIDLTKQHHETIAAFSVARRHAAPYVWPEATDQTAPRNGAPFGHPKVP